MTQRRVRWIPWIVPVLLVVFAAGCGGGRKAKVARDPYRFIREHNLGSLPRFDVPIEINDRVVAWMEFFQGPGRGHFRRYLERSGRYMPLMQEILRKNGMPQDLIYVALIESGFNTQARSYASAVGPWQFISSTGRRYGLRIDSWVDERRDPYKSTQAAVEYLKDLHQEFRDWYLAMAAYNGGEGRVRQAIDATGSRNFWEMSVDRGAFRAETRDYVPKFIAAAIMAKMPERFGFGRIDYKPPFDYETAVVETQTDIPVIARLAGVSEDDVIDLNPHLVGGTTPPGAHDYRIRLPKGRATAFQGAYAALPKEERLQVVRYAVRRGDTLARVARRYGLSARALASANGLSGRQKRLPVGTTLTIPRGGAAYQVAQVSDGDSGRRGRGRDRASGGDLGSSRKGVTHKVRRGDTLAAIARRYDVTPGQIASWNGIRNPKKINVGMKLRIRAGGSAETVRTASAAEPPSVSYKQKQKGTASAPGKVHRVQKGETLSTIASRYGVTVKQLMALNDLQNAKKIRPGMSLAIRKPKASRPEKEPPREVGPQRPEAETTAVAQAPEPPSALPAVAAEAAPAEVAAETAPVAERSPADGSRQASGSFSDAMIPMQPQTTAIDLRERDVQGAQMSSERAMASAKPLPEEAPGSESTVAPAPKQALQKEAAKEDSGKGTISYKVKSGDTLWDIARRHKVSIAQIQKWNNLSDPSAVKPGTTLTIRRE